MATEQPLELAKGQTPLHGAVICCTSLPPDQRDKMHKIAATLGAQCFFDLTMQVTHLVIGETSTPKYAYVAKERPDVKVVLPDFIDAVHESWMLGEEVDVDAAESKHRAPALYGLRICLTGFTARDGILSTIKDNGATHSGDLTRATTHLIAREPKGKKYDMAPKWGVKVVAEEWLRDSVERGMALDESLYNLNIKPEERGKGAWKRPQLPLDSVLGKRTYEEADLPAVPGKRKIRRALSKKLSSQHDAIWSDIATIPAKGERGQAYPTDYQDQPEPAVSNHGMDQPAKPNPSVTEEERTETRDRMDYPVLKSRGSGAIFSGIRVFVYGFSAHKLSIAREHLSSHGARVFGPGDMLDDSCTLDETRAFLLTPHDVPDSQLPSIPEHLLKTATRVTDWWVEICISTKALVLPTQNRFCAPFFKAQIPEFHNLKITSTSFGTMEVLHASKMISLLGATYDEYLGPQVAVLVCGSNKLNLDKIAFAKDKGIPSVNSSWLWACVDEAHLVDVSKYSMSHQQHELRAASRTPSHEATATLKATTHAGPKGQVHKRSLGGKPRAKQKIPPRPTPPNKSSDQPPEPRRHHKPLEEVPLPRLNSPRKSQPSPPIHATTGPDSATPGNATSALAAMLVAKRASRSMPGSGYLPPGRDSDAENPQLRRKRTLGRAASSGSDSLVRDGGGSKIEPPPEQPQGPANGAAMTRSEDSLLLSQKLIYEDPEMRERREKLLAEIGGAKDPEVERAAAAATPAAKTRAGRSKRKRR